MKTLEVLMNNRWILKSKDRELYYKVKDDIGNLRSFLTDKLGYQLIVNPYMIKVEKIPASPENWMGIQEFKEKQDYIFLCYILMFLEDKESEEQFVLSELTEYMQSQCKELKIDWTVYSFRKILIRVIKFCVQSGMIYVDDGDEDNFIKDSTSEVLYENTGVSRYFTRNFSFDINRCTKPEDFQIEEWLDVNEDRGIVRRQRVYRRLFMSIGLDRNDDNEEDYIYVKNYRNMIYNDISKFIDCDLQVYKSSAYLILGQECRMGRCFPEEKTVSDIVLLFFGLLREQIDKASIKVNASDIVEMSYEEFVQMIEKCKMLYGKGFVKKYRDMTTSEFVNNIIEYMVELEFVKTENTKVCFNTVVGKVIGEYPKDFITDGKIFEKGEDNE